MELLYEPTEILEFCIYKRNVTHVSDIPKLPCLRVVLVEETAHFPHKYLMRKKNTPFKHLVYLL